MDLAHGSQEAARLAKVIAQVKENDQHQVPLVAAAVYESLEFRGLTRAALTDMIEHLNNNDAQIDLHLMAWLSLAMEWGWAAREAWAEVNGEEDNG